MALSTVSFDNQHTAARFTTVRLRSTTGLPLHIAVEMLLFQGMGFATMPPLPIQTCPFKFLKSLDLTSVGLSIASVQGNFGWEIVDLSNPSGSVSGVKLRENWWEEVKFVEFVDELDELDESLHEQPLGTGSEPVHMDEQGSEPTLVDYLRDTFGKTGEILTEEVPSSKRPTGSFRSRPKTLASKSLPKPTRKSRRLSSHSNPKTFVSTKESPILVDDLETSPECTPVQSRRRDHPHQASPVHSDEQESQSQTPSRPAPKRKASSRPSPPISETAKKAKTESSSDPVLAKFMNRTVNRGKIFRVQYFRDQGLGVFIEKLQAQGWLALFTDTTLGCSQPDLAEFYARVSVTHDQVTSTVNGVFIKFSAANLREILGVPATGYDVYVREDKTVLGRARLLELAQKFSQQPQLPHPRTVKKGEMAPMHQLLFWFIIKNVIPRGQGRSQADAMDQCLTDLLDRGVQINLPALMIKHIGRTATAARDHVLGYGFLLTRVFEHFGMALRQRVDVQPFDEIGSSTIMGCDFELVQGSSTRHEHQASSPPPPVHRFTALEELQQKCQQLGDDLATMKGVLADQEATNAKRHADILALITELTARLPPPASSTTPETP